MSMFNMGSAANASVVVNTRLTCGIHNVIFKGVDKYNGSLSGIEFRFEATDGSGIHNQVLFEPHSDTRTQSQYGENPSEVEQFMCKIKQIIDALDPELGKKIEQDGSKFAAPSFEGFITLLKKYLDKTVGTTTTIKLVPNKNGFATFPAYVASISRDGNLYMTTKFIGENLVLTSREKTAIENAVNAKPTDMQSKEDELADLRKDFEETASDDDLPF